MTRVPIRQCAGCRERKPQARMQRFVRAAGAGKPAWVPDNARKRSPGRGVYLCRSTEGEVSAECAKRVEKNRKYPGLASAAAEYGLQLG
jgi:predicted RNA-binding protein YlxR (DUF448 family)